MHSGDWRPDPQIVPNLAKHLHEKLGVDVVPQYEPLSAIDPLNSTPELFTIPTRASSDPSYGFAPAIVEPVTTPRTKTPMASSVAAYQGASFSRSTALH